MDKLFAIFDSNGVQVSAAMRCHEFAWQNYFMENVEGVPYQNLTLVMASVPAFEKLGLICQPVICARASDSVVVDAWRPIETLPENIDVFVSGFMYNDETKPRFVVIAKRIGDSIFQKTNHDDGYDELYPPTNWMYIPSTQTIPER